MQRDLVRLSLVALAFVVLAACRDEATETPATATAPIATPVATVTGTTPSPRVDPRRTGIPAIDGLIDAVLKGDMTAVVGQVQYRSIPCVTQPSGDGSPPTCAASEPAGTPVEVFQFAVCAGEWVRPGDVPGRFSNYLPNSTLYAVIKPLSFPPPTTHGVIFDTGRPAPGGVVMLLLNDAGKITDFWRGCGDTPQSLYERLPSTTLVPPP